MSETVSLSPSGRTRAFPVAVIVAVFFLGPVAASLLSLLGLSFGQAFGVTLVGGLALALLWVWRLGGDADGSTWDAIPEWQYNGRFAEAGGLARSEQAEAIEELREEE